jgi:hypothetical protein
MSWDQTHPCSLPKANFLLTNHVGTSWSQNRPNGDFKSCAKTFKVADKLVQTIDPYENNQSCKIEAAISRMSNISCRDVKGGEERR